MNWRDALTEIDEMLEKGTRKRSRSILDMLASMKKWIEENQHVTDKQVSAIMKCKNFGR